VFIGLLLLQLPRIDGRPSADVRSPARPRESIGRREAYIGASEVNISSELLD
jgi:hypothetical protein